MIFKIYKMKTIPKYFSNLTNTQIKNIEMLEDLYHFWNAKINVISRKDMGNLYEKHVLHSLSIAKIIEFRADAKILDAGTGGGFPGIPLAILFENTHFHLVDATQKKINVVANIVKSLKLKNITTHHQRIEHLDSKYDFVLSRAVAEMNIFVKWVKNKIHKTSFHKIKNGIITLKGGNLEGELCNFPKAKIYPISHFFKENFFKTKKIVHIPL